MMLCFFMGMAVQNYCHALMSQFVQTSSSSSSSQGDGGGGGPAIQRPVTSSSSFSSSSTTHTNTNIHTHSNSNIIIPPALDDMIRRAQTKRRHCTALGMTQQQQQQQGDEELRQGQQQQLLLLQDPTVHLKPFGFLDFLEHTYPKLEPASSSSSLSSSSSSEQYPYECVLPPEEECEETQFTVIFMAYNPSRLQKLYNQILKMTNTRSPENEFSMLVKEVVVVWNGERRVEETPLGQALVDLTKTRSVRIEYPLKAGFPNDLFNRYHPRLGITTKAIMYYDDDGPFYSYKAVLGGFELWKRNANAQIGAMARKLDLNDRQEAERLALLNGIGDRNFISSCPTDRPIRYNFNEFAQFGARMVLPSGSFLHRNYLACLWHPVFQELRLFVQQHPVNPDDGTVSAIVSQLAGRAPKVYSRRINEAEGQENPTPPQQEQEQQQQEQRRRLLEERWTDNDDDDDEEEEEEENGDSWNATAYDQRRLMDGINWDAGGDHQKKHDWGKLRSDAADSLIRYFGSVNSGSIGWCYGTKYQRGEYCHPDQARIGQLPWLKPDHTAKDTCP